MNSIENDGMKKLRGGYYTPKIIADFLSNWAIQNKTNLILEPSCGDGIFLESSVNRLKELKLEVNKIKDNLLGVELNSVEAEKALKRIKELGVRSDNTIVNEDFFSFAKKSLIGKNKFDVVLGNPPFIRYQDFLEESRVIAFDIMRNLSLNPSRLTNIWIPFLVTSASLIKHGGRLAMVIPSELFQVNYTAETRKFLTDSFYKINIITFKKLVFKGTQQEVVLFLGEKDGNSASFIKTFELDSLEDLKKLNLNDTKIEEKPMMHSDDKWTYYFLNNSEIAFLKKMKEKLNLQITKDFIDVDVGVVTGENKFFILSDKEVKEKQLEKGVIKIVTRSNHLSGIEFNKEDWHKNLKENYPMYLLNSPDEDIKNINKNLRTYIEEGQMNGFNKGYKCRIRKRWYIIPSLWAPEAFMLRQVHNYPKIIINKNNATSTDTIHRIKFINNANPKNIAAAFLNSITLTFAELTGRSYGGGVLTFEPSECENLPIPMNGIENLDFQKIDKLERESKIDEILDITDKAILIEGYGLSEKDTSLLRKIWKKLRDRRINRRR